MFWVLGGNLGFWEGGGNSLVLGLTTVTSCMQGGSMIYKDITLKDSSLYIGQAFHIVSNETHEFYIFKSWTWSGADTNMLANELNILCPSGIWCFHIWCKFIA